MDLEEEIKKLKEKGPDNPLPQSKMAAILASTLDQAATQWAFKTYWDRKFLKLAKIDSLNQTEKDRVFNELILAPEILIKAACQIWNNEEVNTTLPPFAIAVLCHKHILRSKTKGKDLLFKLIFKNLGRFYTDTLITIGQGKIKTSTKIKIKLRHLANDFKENFDKN